MKVPYALLAALLLVGSAAAACAAADPASAATPAPRPVLLGPYVPTAGSASPAPRGTRNPFAPPDGSDPVAPVVPDEVLAPPAPPVDRSGRNPFLPLVGPATTPAAPVPDEAPAPVDGLLGPGSAGPAVRELQTLLAARGWRITVDGLYGPRTTGVVAALQERRGLRADGITGPLTWAVVRRRP